MCTEALIQWGCCGREWSPDPDGTFIRPLVVVCYRTLVTMTTVRGKRVPVLNPCLVLFRERGLPASDWNGLEALTFPGICDDCREDAQNFGARYEAVMERKRAEQSNIQAIFDRYNVPVRGRSSPFRHTLSLLINFHDDAWLHAEASLAATTQEAKERWDGSSMIFYQWFCETLDDLIGKSAFYRRYVAVYEPERLDTGA